MGNGTSSGQGKDTAYGIRDARKYSAETSYWPELAGAKLADSSGTGRNPYIGAANVGPSSSSVADTQSGAYIGTESSRKNGVYDSIDEQPKSSTVGAASSDEEDNGARAGDHTLRRKKSTLAEMHGSKSSLLDDGTRELAGPPASPLPGANVQELDEQNIDEPLETLGRLAAELNHRLELQKQKKEKRGCGPTGALWGPPAVRLVSGGGPTSGFYGPQVIRSWSKKFMDVVRQSVLRSNRTGDPVCRLTNDGAWPAEQCLQQYR